MTTLARLTIAFLLALFFTSCGFDVKIGDFGNGEKGNGIVTEESRTITDEFSKISASEGLEVYVTQAKDFDIMVEADENIIDLIGTDIKDGNLRIHTIKNIGRATKKIYVSLPEITALRSSSGSHLITQQTINCTDIDIDASSGSLLKAELLGENVEIDASSGANLTVSGNATNAAIDVSSGGNINAKNLETKICHADASSGGNLMITVSESLIANASSGGNISYSGEATLQGKKNISGSITYRD